MISSLARFGKESMLFVGRFLNQSRVGPSKCHMVNNLHIRCASTRESFPQVHEVHLPLIVFHLRYLEFPQQVRHLDVIG